MPAQLVPRREAGYQLPPSVVSIFGRISAKGVPCSGLLSPKQIALPQGFFRFHKPMILKRFSTTLITIPRVSRQSFCVICRPDLLELFLHRARDPLGWPMHCKKRNFWDDRRNGSTRNSIPLLAVPERAHVPDLSRNVAASNPIGRLLWFRGHDLPVACSIFRPECLLSVYHRDTTCFYLRRRDIVLQAISLAKAANSEVFQTANSNDADLQKADSDFTYKGPEIKKWLDHNLDHEIRCALFYKSHDIIPHWINYEDNVSAGQETTMRHVLAILRPDLADAALPVNG